MRYMHYSGFLRDSVKYIHGSSADSLTTVNIQIPTHRRCQEISKHYVCFVCVFACTVYRYMCMCACVGVHFSVPYSTMILGFTANIWTKKDIGRENFDESLAIRQILHSFPLSKFCAIRHTDTSF